MFWRVERITLAERVVFGMIFRGPWGGGKGLAVVVGKDCSEPLPFDAEDGPFDADARLLDLDADADVDGFFDAGFIWVVVVVVEDFVEDLDANGLPQFLLALLSLSAPAFFFFDFGGGCSSSWESDDDVESSSLLAQSLYSSLSSSFIVMVLTLTLTPPFLFLAGVDFAGGSSCTLAAAVALDLEGVEEEEGAEASMLHPRLRVAVEEEEREEVRVGWGSGFIGGSLEVDDTEAEDVFRFDGAIMMTQAVLNQRGGEK